MDKPTLTGNEREYLHLLGLLVQEYEDKHYPIADASVNNILVNLMEEHQTCVDALKAVFESEQDFNALLNGDRDITLKQIQTLEMLVDAVQAWLEVASENRAIVAL